MKPAAAFEEKYTAPKFGAGAAFRHALSSVGAGASLTLTELSKFVSSQSRFALASFASLSVLVVGILDYLSGYEISWSVIYILPIAFATWFVGLRFAIGLSVASIALWIASDLASGATYSVWLIPVWNSAIRLALYSAFVGMLAYVKALTEHLESKVSARTAELEKMERELIEVGERERRRIGSDLHDGLGQHLTATSLAAQVLRRQLLTRGASEAEQANAVVSLLEESVAISQKLAKGLQPIGLHGSGLMQALQDLASNVGEMFKISCQFRCDAPVLVGEIGIAEQLYRIAQEAATNAIKHGRATTIAFSLEPDEQGFLLAIADNGLGFSVAHADRNGMGLRIMSKRASLIGAQFKIVSEIGVGTTISCRVPQDARGA